MKKNISILCLLLCAGCASAFNRKRDLSQWSACKSNEKNIATGLEMYASDNAGYYPSDLTKLTSGKYLSTLPTCYAAQQDTYSGTYKFTAAKRDAKGNVVEGKDSFTFYCRGDHHKGAEVPADLPAYDSDSGLKEK